MKVPRWLPFTIFGVLLFVAPVLLAIGIWMHKEAGLLECVPQWNRESFPLSVSAEQYSSEGHMALQGDELRTLRNAISTVNTRLGFEALRRTNAKDGDIVVAVGTPYDGSWEDLVGHSEIHHSDGHAQLCAVLTSNTGTLEMLKLVLYHEFGHCLGLAHDDYPKSIMYPTMTPTPNGIQPPWFSDYDRRLLRDLYAPP